MLPIFPPTAGQVLPARPLGAGNLLITAARVTFRTLPQAEVFSLRPNFGEIHELPILGTTDTRQYVSLNQTSLARDDEVAAQVLVVDQTTGLGAGIYRRLFRLAAEF
jgi:hypothetical protein